MVPEVAMLQVQLPDAIYPATYEVSGLNAKATPVTKRPAPNRYMGHSQPSGSGFSPGLTPQSHPVGGSNCDSPPWPPCRRVVMERLRAEARGLRAHRTARSGATVCRRMAISGACRRGAPCGGSSGSGDVSGPQWLVEVVLGRGTSFGPAGCSKCGASLSLSWNSGFQRVT
ncbi:hypothetical protein LI328DRAFT_95940 [Trichoderma asperelloides]|nr:hypothetical protein LI328DRAFT_95940 [Trichoderma asperelloides]